MVESRVLVLTAAVFLVTVLAAADVLSPMATGVALAQTEPITTVNGIQLPPPVPGVDYTPVEIETAGPDEGLVVPATPTAPLLTSDSSAVSGTAGPAGTLTTSLRGSDVAMSSVGGSYEVDAPKKRSRRKK